MMVGIENRSNRAETVLNSDVAFPRINFIHEHYRSCSKLEISKLNKYKWENVEDRKEKRASKNVSVAPTETGRHARDAKRTPRQRSIVEHKNFSSKQAD